MSRSRSCAPPKMPTTGSGWTSAYIDAPHGGSVGDGILTGAVLTHESRTLTAQHRIRALFDDGTVGTWSNTVYAGSTPIPREPGTEPAQKGALAGHDEN